LQLTSFAIAYVSTGTNPASGIAVLTAALKKLSTIECRVICTTHFLEVFSLGLLRNDVGGIHVLRMAIHLPESNEDDNATPLFKLEKGVASSSAGLVCARAAGVNKRVVNRAKEIIAALRNGGQVPPDREVHRAASLTGSSKEAIRMFVGNDSWNTASEDDIGVLLRKITEM
jgi:DNA mismatch repair protein MSH5